MLGKKEIAFLASLHRKRFRQEHGLFLAEGRKVSEELLRSGIAVRHIYVSGAAAEEPPSWLKKHQSHVMTISGNDMERISTLSTAPDILCVAAIPEYSFDPAIASRFLVPVLDDISDPGNLGTILRLADWFGLPAVLCTPNTVDAWNAKVVQASMGSLFRVKVYYADPEIFLRSRDSHHPVVYGSSMEGEDLYAAKLDPAGYVVFGNESHGIRSDLDRLLTRRITVPRAAGAAAESLNVAMAAAIVFSEFSRRLRL